MSASSVSHVRLTPSNAKHYIGCDLVFNSRGIKMTAKLLRVSDTGKTVYIDHDDLGGSLTIEKRIVNVVVPKEAALRAELEEKDDYILILKARIKELETTLRSITSLCVDVTESKPEEEVGDLPEFIHDSE
jgi:hypothetical protein